MLDHTTRQLLQCALNNGASQSALLPPRDVLVESRLAAFCRDPKCPYYGQSTSCPPHVSGPAGFKRKLNESQYALVIRFEVDSASLIGEERPLVFGLLQQIVAATERDAKALGFDNAEGFAGGSCKGSLCYEHDVCEVLFGNGQCRNPDIARPSMSGYGVNVGKLMKSAGWSSELFSSDADEDVQMMWLAGLILLK